MADILIYKVEFLTDYQSFVAGDIVDIYADTTQLLSAFALLSSTGIYVKKNGVLFTDSTKYISTDPSQVSIQISAAQICTGTTLNDFLIWSIYPYGVYNNLQNHYSCAINPPTCDLIIIGIPSVIPASGETETDGSINVVATSSNPIEYRLSNDFVYGDGTAQSTGLFNDLLPGTYRVYIRDEFNCFTTILVTVPVNSDFSPVFTLEYDDLVNNKTKIEITRRGYVGYSSEVCGSGTPFTLSLRGEGEDDKFASMIGTTATVELKADSNLQFAEVFTNDPNLYRMNYYKDLGSGYEQKGTYKIPPNQYSERYKAPPYYVSISATDGLSELKDYFLIQGDGQRYFGSVKLIKLVAHCLSVTRLDLDILVACNIVSDAMSGVQTFDEAYVDYELFYLAEREPDLDFVLKTILEPFGVRIFQSDNRWNIVRIEELVDEFDYFIYDKDGDFVSSGTMNAVIDIAYPQDPNDVILVNSDHDINVKPGYGNLRVNYRLGLKSNLLKNGDFRLTSRYIQGLNIYALEINKDGWLLVNAGYVLSEGYETTDDNGIAYKISADSSILSNVNGGNAYLLSDTVNVKMSTNNQLKFSFRVKVDRSSVIIFNATYQIDVPYIKFRAKIQYGSLFLQSSGNWTTEESVLTFFISEFGKFSEFEIVANQPTSGTPLSGMDLSVKVYHAYAYYAEFLDINDLKAFETYDSGSQTTPTGYRTELRDSSVISNKLLYYELKETTQSDDDFYVIRPDDYNSGTNPRQWVQTTAKSIGSIDGTNVFPMTLDKVVMKFLSYGKDPYNTITRSAKAESGNKLFLEKELFIGSYSDLVVTEANFGIGGYGFSSSGLSLSQPSLSIVTTNVISAALVYVGYLRGEDGTGFEFWSRAGVAESDKLHGIFLKQYSAQYKKSFRELTGSFKANTYFSFINVLRETNDNNRIYLPMGLSLDDKRCVYSGNLYELNNIFEDAGSDGTGEAPYNSGFTIGFGASGYR